MSIVEDRNEDYHSCSEEEDVSQEGLLWNVERSYQRNRSDYDGYDYAVSMLLAQREKYLDGGALNEAAPINSPMAKPNVPPFNAAKVEKTSGLPLPNARKVTPAVDSFSPR